MDLYERAKQIRNESQDNANTAWRVGSLLIDIIQLINKLLEGGFNITNELPEEINDNELVLYNGTLWRGLLSDETAYPEKTPWPVSGYKEIIIKTITNGVGELNNYEIKKDDDAFIDITSSFEVETNIEGGDTFFVSGRRVDNDMGYIFNCESNSTSNNIILGLTDGGELANIFTNATIIWRIIIYPPK